MEALQALHERLDTHFGQLRKERDELGRGRPIFALEHGLDQGAIDQLKATVRAALRAGPAPPRWWLPVVVYAAEVGYNYTGHEYWQTFETQTPGWIEHGDRYYIRAKFQEFAKRYRGAKPSGLWAEQFSIICWPITHAVLPTDLQYQLARLLYDARGILPALLGEPDVLGAKLASRAAATSSRFQNFAQNHDLLGQVAAALVMGNDGASPLLLSSTLTRVIADLSVERQARRWLGDARSSVRTRLKGFGQGSSKGESSHKTASGELVRWSDIATLSLRRDIGSSWAVFLELPDLSLLAAQSTALHQALASSRCRVAGVKGPPLAPGRILYPGQRIRLDEWPTSDTQLLRLENANPEIDAMLVDSGSISRGLVWLFVVNDETSADELRGKTIRAGREYVLVGPEITSAVPEWIEPVDIRCDSVRAYTIYVPEIIGAAEEAILLGLNLTVGPDVEIRPVGLVPGLWDGEGQAEWVAGESPLLAIASSRRIHRCALILDGAAPLNVPWPTDQQHDKLFVALSELDVGLHEVQVMLFPEGSEGNLIDGLLSVQIREPRSRSLIGAYREPLLIFANPLQPTLSELWEGNAEISILGPPGLPVDVHVTLERERGVVLASRLLSGLNLPIEPIQWLTEFDQHLRQDRNVYRHYDDATGCLIEALNPAVGTTSLRCGREFTPLRWGAGEDKDGPFLRLHDNAGSDAPSVRRYGYHEPDREFSVPVWPGAEVRDADGGLFVASLPRFTSAALLPPTVKDWRDWTRVGVQPEIQTRTRSVEMVHRLMSLAHLWGSARLPGNPFARDPRNKVLRAFTIGICGSIGGPGWARAEGLVEKTGQAALRNLADALGQNAYQRSILASELRRRAPGFGRLPMDVRIDVFGQVLHSKIAPTLYLQGGVRWTSEFVLRLASSPDKALEWAGNHVMPALELLMKLPVMLCAARYLVLASHVEVADPTGISPYEGWTWR